MRVAFSLLLENAASGVFTSCTKLEYLALFYNAKQPILTILSTDI